MRLIVALIASGLVAGGCASESGRSEQRFIRVELPGRGIVCVEVEAIDGMVSDSLHQLDVIRLPNESRGMRLRNFAGLSGAPVLDECGRVVGACARGFWTSGGQLVGVVTRRELDSLWMRARAFGFRPLRDWRECDGRVVGGASVGAMLVWGDILIGGVGTITEIDGQMATMFAHSVFQERQGPCLALLVRAPPISVVRDAIGQSIVPSMGEAIGCVVYSDCDGACAVLGTYPAPVALRVKVRCVSGTERTSIIYLAPDAKRVAELGAEALKRLRASVSVLRRSTLMSVTVNRRGGDSSTLVANGQGGTDWIADVVAPLEIDGESVGGIDVLVEEQAVGPLSPE